MCFESCNYRVVPVSCVFFLNNILCHKIPVFCHLNLSVQVVDPEKFAIALMLFLSLAPRQALVCLVDFLSL